MARKEEENRSREGERDRDRSRKRKIAEDSSDRNAMVNGEDDDGKRRDKHRHKHHRKHKHRSHKKHKQEDSHKAESANDESVVAVEQQEQKIVDETEDGEILDVEAAGQVEAETSEVLEKQVDGKVGVEDVKGLERRQEQPVSSVDASGSAAASRLADGTDRTRSPERKRRSLSPERKRRSASPERRRRSKSRGETSLSPGRRRRSKSRESLRDYGSRHYSRDPKRRSRSRDRREDNRRLYSPERRRRSKSRDYNDRDRYSRRRGESRERSYRDDRHRDREEKYQRDRTASSREDRKETQPEKQNANLETPRREDDNQEGYLERVEHQLAVQEQEEDIEKVKEESRRRRQAILEKYKSQTESVEVSTNIDDANKSDVAAERKDAAAETDNFAEERKESMSTSDQVEAVVALVDGVERLAKPSAPASHTVSVFKTIAGLGQGTPPKDEREERNERSADMFCDIFGETPPEAHKVVQAKPDGRTLDTSGLTDNWDDAEGYYTYRIGEILDNRYEIASSHGKGVFSTVVRARDTKPSRGDLEEVAIKIIRNNETMYKAGQRELIILKKLAGADPENRRHCVRLLSSFEYRNHLCLVFESLHMNLREILKKFGRNIGISLKAVRSYALQLFTALKHLRNCGVLHCDIKPDNMLVNDSKNVLKLCDFGSAMFAGENEITPYLVSRFYRAPEIILGLPYDHALDMWSVGCCLYELYTGRVLFPGATNNDMLRFHMELKGPFPKKMLKKAGFANQHFDQDFNFLAIEEDPVSKKTMKRVMSIVKPKDISSLIHGNADEDPKMLANFKLLLEKMFMLDPEKRLTVSQALSHPFILGK